MRTRVLLSRTENAAVLKMMRARIQVSAAQSILRNFNTEAILKI